MGENLNIFAIYTAQDKDYMLRVLGQLKPFDEGFNVSFWNDNPILKGQQWKPQIESRLNQTDIFLLFVSDTLMYSQFIKQIEFKWIIDRYKENKSVVVPILVDKCQWDIDFNADDYSFSFKELQVLPEGKKPIAEWHPQDQAYRNVASSIKSVINSFRNDDIEEELENDKEKKVVNVEKEDQTALNFSEEEEVKNRAEELRLKEEEVLAKRAAEEKEKKIKEAEDTRRAEADKRLREEAEAKRIAEEERKRSEEADRIALEAKQFREEAEAKRIAKEVEAKRNEEHQKNFSAQAAEEVEEIEQEVNTNIKKWLVPGLLIAVLAVIGIWIFSDFKKSPEKPLDTLPQVEEADAKDSTILDKIKKDPVKKAESLSKLAIGDSYNGGIVFSLDSSGKTGKIVHIDDAGPMSWQNAMQIHEQLGEGWRLPTFNELVILYQTVGQGADNSAEFADGLYWSATDFDEYQARLVKFSNGNTSYHYNKNVESRKFRVRAVRDFSR